MLQGKTKDSGTDVQVKMKNLLNGNEWLWSRAKFFDRRFQFQAMYQEWVEKEDPKSPLKGVPKDAVSYSNAHALTLTVALVGPFL